MGSEITQEQLRAIGQKILRYYRSECEYHGGYQSDVFRETRRENRRGFKIEPWDHLSG